MEEILHTSHARSKSCPCINFKLLSNYVSASHSTCILSLVEEEIAFIFALTEVVLNFRPDFQ